MTEAEALYRRHLEAVTAPDPAAIRDLWEADGVLEFPCAPPGGVARLEGVAAITVYFTGLPLFGAFTFRDLVVLPVGQATADGFLAQVHGSSTLRSTGAAYEQDYVVRFGVSARGRLAWMREWWDPTRA